MLCIIWSVKKFSTLKSIPKFGMLFKVENFLTDQIIHNTFYIFCSVLICFILYYSILFCSFLFCSVLFCFVLFCPDLIFSIFSKFYPSEVVKSLFIVPNLLILEPCLWVFACQLRAQIVPFSSLQRACFELNWCRFRAQIVPFSSPRRYSFEPKSCRFRDISVNNGQNDSIFHKETNRHTRDK